jgi:hypothetical protein
LNNERPEMRSASIIMPQFIHAMAREKMSH